MVIDLPNGQGVDLGATMSSAGYFPIPLYNGVSAPQGVTPVIDNSGIQAALAKKAELLHWPEVGGPAFLLDSRRMSGWPRQGYYDNRWVTMPQDFPTGDKLKSAGINRCYAVTERGEIQKDLQQILARWQDAGITVFAWENGKFAQTPISPPNMFQRLLLSMRTRLEFSPNPAGGFGAIVSRSG